MKSTNWIFIIIGFVLLTCYFQVTNAMFHGVIWVVFALLFFPFAHFVCKLCRLQGLKSIGYTFHKGGLRNLIVGFSLGFGTWGIMYGSFFLLGRYELAGLSSGTEIVWLVLQALIGMFLGSTINDAIVRGFLFAQLAKKFSLLAIIFITSGVYAFDDIWFAGFSLFNTIFSIILGLSLALAFAKTKSIWFTTGIHWGLNVMYCLVNGLPGSGERGGIFVFEIVHMGPKYQIVQIGVTILLFVLVLTYFHLTIGGKLAKEAET